MKEQLAIPGAELERATGPALAAVRAAQAALERVRNPDPPNTKKAYDRARELYGAWCDITGTFPPFPVQPERLVSFLEWLSTEAPRKNAPPGYAPNTVRLAMAAICTMDRDARVTPSEPNPISIALSPIVRRWQKSWRRDNPRAPRRKAPAIGAQQLWRLLEVINEPTPRCARAWHVVRACRDRAMVLIGIYGALRVSELVALDLSDVRFVDRGLELRLRSSKTDQLGEGKWKGILPAGARGVCAVDAWSAWLRVRGSFPGPAFVSISRTGELGTTHMDERTAKLMIERHGERAGLDLSSHSMRATFATLAGKHGHAIEAVAEHMGHSSIQTTAGYMRRGSLFDEKNPTAGLFDGD